MENIISSLDRQIEDALSIGRSFQFPAAYKKFSNIVFSGMGGSAIGGDILSLLNARQGKVPFQVNRLNRLPAWVDSKTLLLLSSYSGNTQETLEAFEEGLKRKAKICILSSGGELTARARKKKLPALIIPSGLPPRCAIGYTTFSLIPALKKLGCITEGEKDFKEAVLIVRNAPREEARVLAKRLHGRSVHFYGMAGFAEPALVRWRGQLAENAKMLASHHLLPEMFHNETEGWLHPEKVTAQSAAVFLLDRETPGVIQRKIAALRKHIEKTGAETLEVKARGKSFLARVFSLIILGDWTSYELALLNQVDPAVIPAIEAVKKIT